MMSPKLREHFEREMGLAMATRARGNHAETWYHLERSHVLSQAYAWPHVRVHWRMLMHGWTRHDWREVAGQLIRVLVAAPGSWLGRAPIGNTGGANVGILQPMPIPPELQRMLEDV